MFRRAQAHCRAESGELGLILAWKELSLSDKDRTKSADDHNAFRLAEALKIKPSSLIRDVEVMSIKRFNIS